MFPDEIVEKANALLTSMKSRGLTLATVESCTGGLLSAAVTAVSGSSEIFTHGYITYANDAKCDMVAVDPALIQQHGAVSKEVAIAMAEGARALCGASIAISVTGIAGPSGATPGKPVGTVHMAVARKGHSTLHQHHHFTGDRAAVRMQSVLAAIELIQQQLNH